MKQHAPLTDTELISLIIKGDTSTYEKIMVRYEQKLLRYVNFLMYDPDAAADVVQDTFIKAYQNLQSYKPKYNFSTWIYRIAHNEAMNAIKKNRRIVHQSDIEDIPQIFSEESGIESKIDRDILRKDVQHCMRELSPNQREILILYYFQEMKYAEISSVLWIPSASVGVNLLRAKQALKAICQKHRVEYEA
jgi:RNA polymerase sigma-70 factor (ECF subfamily)